MNLRLKRNLYIVLRAVGLGILLFSTGANRLPSSGDPPFSEVRLPGGGRMYGMAGSISSDIVAASKEGPESASTESARLRAVFEATQSNWVRANQFLDRAAR